MKEDLQHIAHLKLSESGYIFPFISILFVFCLLTLTTSLTLYVNHVTMTALELEQYTLETLYQMATREFHELLPQLLEENQTNLSLTYPPGIVEINYSYSQANELSVTFRLFSNDIGKEIIIEQITLNEENQ